MSRAGEPSHKPGGGRRHRPESADAQPEPVEVNGWTIFAHPLFLDQVKKLDAAAKTESKNFSAGNSGPNTKLLAHILDLAFYSIPADPGSPAFRQGRTLGDDYKHWSRGKTGNGRYRLFFRYSTARKIIVYAWVNDSNSLRTYNSPSDAYAVFAGMLKSGNPPDNWDALVAGALTKEARKALAAICGDPSRYGPGAKQLPR